MGTPAPKPRNIDYAPNSGESSDRLRAGWLTRFGDSTAGAYRRDLDQFCDWADLDDPLNADRALIQSWLHHLAKTGLKPPTIRRKASALSSFYDYAAVEGAIPTNIARHTRRPRGGDGQRLGLDLTEAQDVVRAAEQHSPTAYALIALLMVVGLRVSEACGADISDLSTDAGIPVLQITRKGGHTARVPIPERVLEALEAVTLDREEGPLLTGPRGGRLTRKRAGQLVAELGARTGLPTPLSPHLCRHTAATNMLRAGVPLEKVQAVLGHRSPETTLRYVRALQGLDPGPSIQLAEALMGFGPKDQTSSGETSEVHRP